MYSKRHGSYEKEKIVRDIGPIKGERQIQSQIDRGVILV